VGKRWDRLTEWATNVTEGKTLDAQPHEVVGDWGLSARREPPVRVKRAMIVYAKTRDVRRWNRLQQDYAWLKGVMEDMGMNPEDARFLL
jgi:hypothetical protein